MVIGHQANQPTPKKSINEKKEYINKQPNKLVDDR